MAARSHRPGPRKRRQRGREQAQHRLSLRRLQRLLSALARRGRWSTPAPISTIGATTSTRRRRNKLDMVCRKLRLKAGETMLDIGSGWGSLACHAARHYGVSVVGVTLSRAADRLRPRQGGAARPRRPGDLRAERLRAARGARPLRQDQLDRHVRTRRRRRNFDTLFRHGAAAAEAWRPLPASRDHPARQGRHAARTGEEAAGVRGADALHLSRRRTRLPRRAPSPISKGTASRCATSKAGASTTSAPAGCGTTACCARYDEACAEVGETTTRVWLVYLAACSIVFERNNCGVYQTLVCKRVRGASGLPPTRADLYR